MSVLLILQFIGEDFEKKINFFIKNKLNILKFIRKFWLDVGKTGLNFLKNFKIYKYTQFLFITISENDKISINIINIINKGIIVKINIKRK